MAAGASPTTPPTTPPGTAGPAGAVASRPPRPAATPATCGKSASFTWSRAKGTTTTTSTAALARNHRRARRGIQPAGATRWSAIAATRLSQTAKGAPGSPWVRTSAARARTAGRGPKSRWTARVTMRTKKKPRSVQREVQVPGRRSTPVEPRRLQPGGTCRVAWSCSTPVVQPTAGIGPPRARRESASSCRAERRSSTPAAFVSGCAVTSWSWPSTATRPRVPGGEEVEARRRAQRPAEAVADARAAPVGIEPELAREGERVGRGLGLAPPHLLEGEARARLDEERRQRAPLLGQLGPRGVDGRGAGELDLPLRLVGGEDPHLARGPGLPRRLLRQADRLRAALDARLDAHGVAAAAHLHAQAVLLDARRQVARDGHGNRARQERSRERDLPRAARHLQLEARLDEERDAVPDAAEDLEPEALAFASRLGAGAQPEEAGLVAPRPGHGLAVEAQVHEADLRGDAQRLGQARPGEAAGHAVAAGARARRSGAPSRVEDGGGGAVEADVLRPVLRAAREAHVDRAVGLQLEAEGAAARSEVEPAAARATAQTAFPWTVAQPRVGTWSSTHGTHGRRPGGRSSREMGWALAGREARRRVRRRGSALGRRTARGGAHGHLPGAGSPGPHRIPPKDTAYSENT